MEGVVKGLSPAVEYGDEAGNTTQMGAGKLHKRLRDCLKEEV
jgi:hypothetical protein